MQNLVEVINHKGFIDLPIDERLNLIDEIQKLKHERNAVILAHYYQTGDIQDLADFVGDSLQLARKAKESTADIILFAGVHFMAETAKILNPNKKVLIPDLKAGCSLADSCPPDKFKEFKDKHPGAVVISYINCTAEIKALTDIICTSSNAEAIVRSISEDTPIIFAPDKNLGAYLNKKLNRDMILWDGACMVHEAFSLDRILDLAKENPTAKIIAHPESEAHVLDVASFIGSTSALLNYVEHDEAQAFIVATEEGILHEMKKRAPHKTLIPAPTDDESCACSECFYMKRNTLEKIYLTLKYELPELTMTPELIDAAKKPIERMLDLSKNIK